MFPVPIPVAANSAAPPPTTEAGLGGGPGGGASAVTGANAANAGGDFLSVMLKAAGGPAPKQPQPASADLMASGAIEAGRLVPSDPAGAAELAVLQAPPLTPTPIESGLGDSGEPVILPVAGETPPLSSAPVPAAADVAAAAPTMSTPPVTDPSGPESAASGTAPVVDNPGFAPAPNPQGLKPVVAGAPDEQADLQGPAVGAEGQAAQTNPVSLSDDLAQPAAASAMTAAGQTPMRPAGAARGASGQSPAPVEPSAANVSRIPGSKDGPVSTPAVTPAKPAGVPSPPVQNQANPAEPFTLPSTAANQSVPGTAPADPGLASLLTDGGEFTSSIDGGVARSVSTATADPAALQQMGATETRTAVEIDKPVPLAQPRGAHAPPPADQIAIQISRAAEEGSGRLTVQLQPHSLGSITIDLDIGTDSRVVAAISAERADTLDLLQRDARALERALNEAGLKADMGSLSFNLRGGDQDTGGDQAFKPVNFDRPQSADETADLAGPHYQQPRLRPDGIDIRV